MINNFVIIIGTLGITVTITAINMTTQLFIKFLDGSPFLVSCNSLFGWLGLSIGAIFWSYFSDKLGTRKVFIVIILFFFICVGYSFSFVDKIYQLLILRFIISFFSGGFAPIVSAFILERTDNKLRGRAISKFNTPQSAGWSIGIILAGFLLKETRFHFTYRTVIIGTIFALLFSFFLQEKEKIISSNKLKDNPNDSPNKLVDFLLIGITFRKIGIMGLFSLVYAYMQIKHIPTHIMGMIGFSNAATQTILMPFCGRLADKIDRRKIVLLGIFLSIFPPIIIAMAVSRLMFLLGFITIGISWSVLISGTTTFFSEQKKKMASSIASFWVADAIGGTIGALIAGSIANFAGYQIAFVILSVIISIGLIIASKK